MKNMEICNECGRSVSWGSGLFVNRVIDLDDYETRRQMNKPFPEGDYICRECDERIYNSECENGP
jgi:diaminopimelate decarboxylase